MQRGLALSYQLILVVPKYTITAHFDIYIVHLGYHIKQ